ncbi:hypothetical protein PR048_010890 [Dryococelus australis]|uniref:Uncharacterized protein n=1 Tax=Dryococelus australis TaxID=614101 RepID=A0ABQ9I400_9NEOP|nr:hypothetical protein PR048_010890 [Dryococelus australis]
MSSISSNETTEKHPTRPKKNAYGQKYRVSWEDDPSFKGCLTELGSTTADVLFDSVQKSFQEGGIELHGNLLGMAGDGANVIMGANNSLSSHLKEVLPSSIQQLTRDTVTSVAVLREFQEFVGTEPHKILHPAQTRWLSFLPVVKRLLEQFYAHILFFQDGSLPEGIPAAQYILTTLRDPTYKLYLEVLEFVLPCFEYLNRETQSEKPKLFLLYDRIAAASRSILQCYIKQDYLARTPVEGIHYRNPSNYAAACLKYASPRFGSLYYPADNTDVEMSNTDVEVSNTDVEVSKTLVDGTTNILPKPSSIAELLKLNEELEKTLEEK